MAKAKDVVPRQALGQQKIIDVNIVDEMKKSYIDYSMSVIVGRALPDVRDGMKPIHRRILYGMYEAGNTHDKAYKKSATTVGHVMGRYHPHGDTAIYDTMVRMAQDFSLRYPLVDGQGNFGSIDGDNAAAMRYTEARMAKIGELIMDDLEKQTVQWQPNFDESLKEPVVLPCKIPNLLINGSQGIAVGMATNIPPHNITEVINGTIALAKKSDMEVSDLMKYISGPDFPTAAFIYGRSGIKDAYETGRGMIKLRAKAEIEDTGTKTRIIVSEIPYMVNKSKLITDIADLVRNKTIEGISNIKDESNRQGIRVVIDIKRDANANVVLNQLFKHTQMETSFGINNLALVDGVPRTLSLKEMIQCFIDHRFIVVTNRCDFEMKKAAEREHILTGFITAMKDIDAIVSLIRKAENAEGAKISLMGAKFNFSEEQAKAILDLKLARLTSMERSKVEAERAELIKQIAYLKEVLADPAKRTAIVIKELEDVKAKFGDARRTQIKDDLGEITNEQLIPEETVAVIMTNTGYIKRIPIDIFRTQKRGGMGASGITTKDGDFIKDMFVSSTHDYVMFFTNKGRVYSVKVYDIESPQSKQSMGRAIVNLLNLQQGEKVVVAIPVHEFDENHYVTFATKLGTVKKTALSDFANIRSTGIIAIGLDPEDELIGVRITNGKNEILLASANGQSIRFSEEDVRSMGRAAAGVIGMRLQRDDKVIGMEVMAAKESGVTVLTICENGFGKRTDVDEYRIQGRGGSGVINIQTTRRNGAVVAIANVKDNDQFAIMTKKGIMIRTPVAGVRMIGRNCQGVRAIKLDDDDLVATVTKIASEDIVE